MELKCIYCSQDVSRAGKLISEVIIKRSSLGNSIEFEEPIKIAHIECYHKFLKVINKAPTSKKYDEPKDFVKMEDNTNPIIVHPNQLKSEQPDDTHKYTADNAELLKANAPKKRGRKPKYTEAE